MCVSFVSSSSFSFLFFSFLFKKLVVYHSSDHAHRRSNAALLVCAFAMVELKRGVIDA
jgi:hypothetical protein